jgi:hypothetical protein
MNYWPRVTSNVDMVWQIRMVGGLLFTPHTLIVVFQRELIMLVVRSLWLEKEKTIWDFYILSLLWLLVVLLAYMSGSDFSVPGEDPENPNPRNVNLADNDVY